MAESLKKRANGRAQLIDAIKRGDIDTFRRRVRGSTESFNSLLSTALSPFHTFPKKPAHVEIVRELLRSGADPNARVGWQNEPALCLASKSSTVDFTSTLLEFSAQTDIFSAAAIGDHAKVQKLLRDGKSLLADMNGMSALHYCAASALGKRSLKIEDSFCRTAVLLLDNGANPNLPAVINKVRITPLTVAAWTGGSVRLAALLADRGADARDETTFYAALGHFQRHGDGHYELAGLLVSRGADVNIKGDPQQRTPLHAFAAHEDIVGVKWLLTHGADVQAKTSIERTALHEAARRNAGMKIIRLLLEAGADASAKDSDGRTAIEYARERGKSEFFKKGGSGASR